MLLLNSSDYKLSRIFLGHAIRLPPNTMSGIHRAVFAFDTGPTFSRGLAMLWRADIWLEGIARRKL